MVSQVLILMAIYAFLIVSSLKNIKDLQEGRRNHELITILLMTVVILISLICSWVQPSWNFTGLYSFVISGYYFSVLYKKREAIEKLDEVR